MELSIDTNNKLFNVLLFNQFLKSVLIREIVKIPLSQSTVDIGKISPIAASLVRLGNIDIISGVRTLTHQRLHTYSQTFYLLLIEYKSKGYQFFELQSLQCGLLFL